MVLIYSRSISIDPNLLEALPKAYTTCLFYPVNCFQMLCSKSSWMISWVHTLTNEENRFEFDPCCDHISPSTFSMRSVHLYITFLSQSTLQSNHQQCAAPNWIMQQPQCWVSYFQKIINYSY